MSVNENDILNRRTETKASLNLLPITIISIDNSKKRLHGIKIKTEIFGLKCTDLKSFVNHVFAILS